MKKDISHQEQLKKIMMHLYAKQYRTQEHSERSSKKKRLGFLVGGLSFIGAGSAMAIALLTTTLTTTQPRAVTAEELLSDASTQLDILNQMKDDEVYHVTIKNVETQLGEIYNEQGKKITPEPIVTKEEEWTDGTLYRRDRYSPKETVLNSTLWTIDDGTHGTEWYWQQEYENEYMGQNTLLTKQTFSDYPASGSILDTNAGILDVLPTDDSNEDTEQSLEQQWNTDFQITGEEDVDGVPSYRLTGYTLGMEMTAPTMNTKEIQDSLITREYWIAKDGHRLIKEQTIIPDHGQYETYYSVGEITHDVKKLNFDTWKKEFGITEEEVQNAYFDREIYVTPENLEKEIQRNTNNFDETRVQICQDITGNTKEDCIAHYVLKTETLNAWEDCAKTAKDIYTCNEQLAKAVQEKETFLSFCEQPVTQCEQTYEEWKNAGFKNTP